MSLGLNDLSKKRAAKAATNDSVTNEKPRHPSGAWAARSTTARPWSSNGVSKQNRRKSPIDTEAAMNEDWMNAAPLFWQELSQDSRMVRLQEKLAAVESAIEIKIKAPLTALRNFCLPRRMAR
jgi:hypothetical protein